MRCQQSYDVFYATLMDIISFTAERDILKTLFILHTLGALNITNVF